MQKKKEIYLDPYTSKPMSHTEPGNTAKPQVCTQEREKYSRFPICGDGQKTLKTIHSIPGSPKILPKPNTSHPPWTFPVETLVQRARHGGAPHRHILY